MVKINNTMYIEKLVPRKHSNNVSSLEKLKLNEGRKGVLFFYLLSNTNARHNF